jgi:hypothetical protein
MQNAERRSEVGSSRNTRGQASERGVILVLQHEQVFEAVLEDANGFFGTGGADERDLELLEALVALAFPGGLQATLDAVGER